MNFIPLIEVLVTVISLGIAAFKHIQAKDYADAADEIATAYKDLMGFFTVPNQPIPTPPAVTVALPGTQIPSKSWRMSDEIRAALLSGYTPDQRLAINAAVNRGEIMGKTLYYICDPQVAGCERVIRVSWGEFGTFTRAEIVKIDGVTAAADIPAA